MVAFNLRNKHRTFPIQWKSHAQKKSILSSWEVDRVMLSSKFILCSRCDSRVGERSFLLRSPSTLHATEQVKYLLRLMIPSLTFGKLQRRRQRGRGKTTDLMVRSIAQDEPYKPLCISWPSSGKTTTWKLKKKIIVLERNLRRLVNQIYIWNWRLLTVYAEVEAWRRKIGRHMMSFANFSLNSCVVDIACSVTRPRFELQTFIWKRRCHGIPASKTLVRSIVVKHLGKSDQLAVSSKFLRM